MYYLHSLLGILLNKELLYCMQRKRCEFTLIMYDDTYLEVFNLCYLGSVIALNILGSFYSTIIIVRVMIWLNTFKQMRRGEVN